MTGQVANACQTILADPSLVPPRVAKAAARLMKSFGDRDFGRIGHLDFDNYLEAAAGGLRSDTGQLGGPAEDACYDIYILGTLALWQGKPAFYASVEDWLRPHMELNGRRPS